MIQTDAEFIAELRALAEKATGLPDIPWEARNGDVYFDGERVAQNCWSEDAAFIAASRTAIPRFLDMVERLEKEVARHEDTIAGLRASNTVKARDTALAEVARLREALIDIGFRQNLSRDQIVMFARAALAPKE